MTRRLGNLSLLAALLFMGAQWGAAVQAQTAPGASRARPANETGGHQHHRRGPKRFMMANAEGASIELWKPDLERIPLELEMGAVTIPATGVDNYHALVAEKDWGDARETIIRYEYLRGKPSKRSPSELTAARKSAFEIVPDPLPREHQHYESAETWDFLVRFEDAPVADLPVSLETAHGSMLEAVSDAGGRVSFALPDDFPDLVEGERDERSAELQVSSEYRHRGITYQTTLSSEYEVNPSHWQSTPLGLAVTGFGFLAGMLLGRKQLNGREVS